MDDSFVKFNVATMPINVSDDLFLDVEAAKEFGQKLHFAYVNANPFPHTVIDNFFPQEVITKIIENFPARKVQDEVVYELGRIGHHKRQVPPSSCNGFNRNLFAFLNSAPMLKFLESLSGIKSLIPDPYFNGGGYHETFRGGFLGIHADFRLNKQLNLHRRLNMIIYLNEDWQDEWGGQLELWDKSMKKKVVGISPVINRCAIFSTDADSYHGHPDQLNCPESRSRRSIALYYYTASENIYDEVPDKHTVYVERPEEFKSQAKTSFSLKLDAFLSKNLPLFLYRLIIKVRMAVKNLLN